MYVTKGMRTKDALTNILRPALQLRGDKPRVARTYEALPRDVLAVLSGKVVSQGFILDLTSTLRLPISL